MDNAVYVNDNGDESSKLDGGNGVENVVQIVSDLFISFFFVFPTYSFGSVSKSKVLLSQ